MIKREDFSEEQEAAFVKILDFIKSTERQMLLSGFAGVGKTALLNVLVDYYKNNDFFGEDAIICTAPTNEAVRIISNLTGQLYDKTIYSLLELRLVEDEDKPPKLVKANSFKKTPPLEGYELVVIDEASMISEDLFDMIQHELDKTSRVKILYVGDSAQLPPVKDKGKNSKVFDLQNQIEMTQVQRTAKENPIIKVVTDIRNNLESNVDVFKKESIYNKKTDSGIEFYTDKKKFLELIYNDFTSNEYKKNDDYVRVLAYRNKTVDTLNSLIRKKIFGKKNISQFVIGDKLIVDQPILDNDKSILFTVGTRLKVVKAELDKDHEHGIKFWVLKVETYGSRYTITRNIHVIDKEYINVYRITLASYAKEAKEKLYNKKNKFFNKKEVWRPYFDFKNQFSWVKYANAVTVHKSQGSTFRNVYVINSDCNVLSWNHVERNKLKYVAFTRASHLLRII